LNHQKTSHTSPGIDRLAGDRGARQDTMAAGTGRGPAGARTDRPTEEPWLVRPEAAARLVAVSRSTLYDLLAQGKRRSATINRCRRIPVEAWRAWLAEPAGWLAAALEGRRREPDRHDRLGAGSCARTGVGSVFPWTGGRGRGSHDWIGRCLRPSAPTRDAAPHRRLSPAVPARSAQAR
jgi:hypothetical protein